MKTYFRDVLRYLSAFSRSSPEERRPRSILPSQRVALTRRLSSGSMPLSEYALANSSAVSFLSLRKSPSLSSNILSFLFPASSAILSSCPGSSPAREPGSGKGEPRRPASGARTFSTAGTGSATAAGRTAVRETGTFSTAGTGSATAAGRTAVRETGAFIDMTAS